MSTTGSILVQDAAYLCQILGQDQTLSSGDSALILRILNRMIDAWANDDLTIPGGVTVDSFTMTPAVASYATTLLTTMGRPTSIDSIKLRLSNIDYVVELIDNQSFDAISYKPAPGIPAVCHYDAENPVANFNFYPTPHSNFVCYISGFVSVTGAIGMETTVNLPRGYEQAIIENLAVKIWRSFKGTNKPLPPDLYKQAMDSLAWLKRTNFTPLEMDTGLGNGDPSINVMAGFRQF